MSIHRQSVKNTLTNEYLTLERKVERLTQTNRTLPQSGIRDESYLSKQISENNILIDQSNERIEELKERIKKIDKGELDNEISAEIDDSTQKVRSKEQIFLKKKTIKNEEHAEKKKKIQESYRVERKLNYSQKQLNYEMRKDGERFMNFEIPDYITENLKNMPNNKGYIWKGVWCFGQLPSEKNDTCVMFEKQRDVTFIHEIYPEEHIIYKKTNNGAREHVKTIRRRLIDKSSLFLNLDVKSV